MRHKLIKMNPMKILFCVICVLLTISGCNLSVSVDHENGPGPTEKPNVLIILGDQWRSSAVGYAGNADVITPHLDSLANESIVFTNAVSVLPACTPYRASLLTGQYPLTHGAFQNDRPLVNEALTMAEVYKDAGYRTGYIGKWHLNGHQNGELPHASRKKPIPKERRQGFDYWKAVEVTHDYNNSIYFDENDQKHIWPGYDAFAQTDSAISFIKKDPENPFLLVLSWGPPHNPYFTAPAEYQQMYQNKKLKIRPNVPEALRDSAQSVYAAYYAHCTALDAAMGQLLRVLDEEGIADNTVLVFSSDHGDMLLSRGAYGKQSPWNESVQVPLLIRYPAAFKDKSQVVRKPINTPDIFPTLLGLSDISVPGTVEGTDVSRALRGSEPYPVEAALFMSPVPFSGWSFKRGGREYRAVRTERYTYARDLKGPWMLFDNEVDPYQENNLVEQEAYSDIRSRLDGLLTEQLKKTNDLFLPADDVMKEWNYHYDFNDSLRPLRRETGK